MSQAGLVPVMRLAESCGLPALAYEHVRIGLPCGANPHLKIPAIVAGMAAGAVREAESNSPLPEYESGKRHDDATAIYIHAP